MRWGLRVDDCMKGVGGEGRDFSYLFFLSFFIISF